MGALLLQVLGGVDESSWGDGGGSAWAGESGGKRRERSCRGGKVIQEKKKKFNELPEETKQKLIAQRAAWKGGRGKKKFSELSEEEKAAVLEKQAEKASAEGRKPIGGNTPHEGT